MFCDDGGDDIGGGCFFYVVVVTVAAAADADGGVHSYCSGDGESVHCFRTFESYRRRFEILSKLCLLRVY